MTTTATLARVALCFVFAVGGVIAFASAQNVAANIAEIKQKAEAGNARAQASLGYIYDKGIGVEVNDDEAVKWYRLSAEQGNAEGQAGLGYMYNEGRGVSKNYTEAVLLYRLAAEQGNARAQNNLGGMYFDGRGVEKNEKEALKWFRLAAEQGHFLAIKLMAKFGGRNYDPYK